MAGVSFLKRQKEMKRKEKRQMKEDKRAARKLMKTETEPEQTRPEGEPKVEDDAI
jgi:hypothetical protein